jgi:HlyD family secretion protein
MEMKILRQERCDAQRRLERATTQSDRDGVLTWVTPEEGAVVREGDLIARIADLNSFRVEATLSDVHASDLSAGLVARVRINDAYLDGGITNVLPTIKDGVMTIIVGLNDKSSPLLRSNLRVDVYLVTARKGRALKVKRGPSIPGSGRQDVFVIRGDMAVKTPVVIGISSFDEAEVQSGLLEGDEVIVSDMTDHLHRKEVRVR